MKKKKVWSSVSRIVIALMFISSWVVLGISFALTSVSVKLSGGISFSATGIYAEISGKIDGATDTLAGQTLSVSADTTDFETENATALNAWQNLDLAFGDGDITITITIKNLSTENGINVTFTDNLDKDKSGNTIGNLIVERNGSSTPLSTLTVDKSTSEASPTVETITITLRVDDRNKSIDYKDNWGGLSMNLTSSAVKDVNDADYSVFTFADFDSSKQTCSIAKNADNLPTGALVIPAEVKKDGVVYTVTSLADNAFQGCKNITSVILPNTVTLLGDAAFKGCTGTTSITIPSSVTRFEGHCFEGCFALESIIYEGTPSLEYIGVYNYYNCQKLKTTIIPASVTTIVAKAFSTTHFDTIVFEGLEGHTWTAGSTDVTEAIKDPETAKTYLTETYVAVNWERK